MNIFTKIVIAIGILIAVYLLGYNIKGCQVQKERKELISQYDDTIKSYRDSILISDVELKIKDSEISTLQKELSKNREFLLYSLNLIGKQPASLNYSQVQAEIQEGGGSKIYCFDSVGITDINLKLTERKYLIRDTSILGEMINKYRERIEITNNQKQYFLDLCGTLQKQNTLLKDELNAPAPFLSFNGLKTFIEVSNQTKQNIREATLGVGFEGGFTIRKKAIFDFSIYYEKELRGRIKTAYRIF